MESNHVRDLMEAYSSIYAENEEVEQLDEFAPGLQGPVDRFLKGGQKVLKGLGLKVNEKERPTPDQNAQKAKINQNQSFDLFDIIKGHLLDEGFADTEEAALAIMTNMSEEWREQILDEANRPEREMIKKGLLKSGQVGRVRNLNRDSGNTNWYGQDPRDQPSIQRPGRSFGRTGPNNIKQRRQKYAQEFDAFYTSKRRDEHDESRGKKQKDKD